MRETRFRAWDAIDGGWVDESWMRENAEEVLFGWLGLDNKFGIPKEISVMQSTGLHDATPWEKTTPEQRQGCTKETWNGVEIYEGDIVAGLWYDKDSAWAERYNFAVVKYGPDRALYVPFPRFFLEGLGAGILDWRDMGPSYMEVIGNIWENKDLLHGRP